MLSWFLLFLLPSVLAVVLSFACYCGSACGSACGSGCGCCDGGGNHCGIPCQGFCPSSRCRVKADRTFLVLGVPCTLFLMILDGYCSQYVPTLDFALCSEEE